jgi:chemotaxis protein CheD
MQQENFIYQGGLQVLQGSGVLKTVLGSCVSVCLWDFRRSIGGMNHYMLDVWNGKSLATPRYGNIAMPQLLELMENHGSRKQDLLAKVFGGSALMGYERAGGVGERNVNFALEWLEQQRIPVKAQSLGGLQGRKIRFHVDTGLVQMKKIQNTSELLKNTT